MNELPDKSVDKQSHKKEPRKYPAWLRWLLAKWWGFTVLVVLGLFTNILLLPLAQGFDHWRDGVLSQVAALVALPHTKPALTILGLTAIIILTVLGYLANNAIKEEERSNSEKKERTITREEIQQGIKEPLNDLTTKMLTAVHQGFQEREIITAGEVTIESFSINPKKCGYKQHTFDPLKPLWPEEDHGAVKYGPGKVIGMYGRDFSSREEAEAYGSLLRETRNHSSFSKDSRHKIYFERLQSGTDKNKANYPIFYVSVRNTTNVPVILNSIEAVIIDVEPTVSVGESHTLKPLEKYELVITRENTSLRMIPNIKIAPNDAAAFEVLLKHNSSRVGSAFWTMKLRLHYSDSKYSETDIFLLLM